MPDSSTDRAQRQAALTAALNSRILVLDGAMGTMIQRHKLDEAGYRGTRFAAHPKDVKGNNDLLILSQPEIILDIHRAYQDVGKAQVARELAQAELQLARDQLSIVLAQAGEGRVAMRQVEEARFGEDEKWIAFFEADAAVERARFNVLRQTGEIVAALK